MRSWWFSLALLLGYLLTFQLWRTFPDRAAFLVFGALAVIGMVAGMRRAARQRYFVDRSDLVLHGLVIFDVALECVSYELFNAASQCIFCAPADAGSFHGGANFCWCAAILGVLVGGYHGWALRHARGPQGRTTGGDSTGSPPGEAAPV
ncbi:MAG TPA: hypothetical protein VHY91_24765 [Pirellulales bacterium]|jgi:hypothetical protein|nr:hypothetical protein [Pirellulales bacterium]